MSDRTLSAEELVAQPSHYSGVWVDANAELPEDGEPVLVLTEEYVIGFGYVLDGEW